MDAASLRALTRALASWQISGRLRSIPMAIYGYLASEIVR
jgi:hypothetical protein